MKKRITIILAILINVLLFAGCGGKPTETHKFDVDNIKHSKEIYVTETRYYEDKAEIRFNCSIEDCSLYVENQPNLVIEATKNIVTVYSDNPETVTSLIVKNGIGK